MKPRSATAVGRFGAPIFAAALVFFSISEARAQGIVAQATGGTGAASATQAFPPESDYDVVEFGREWNLGPWLHTPAQLFANPDHVAHAQAANG